MNSLSGFDGSPLPYSPARLSESAVIDGPVPVGQIVARNCRDRKYHEQSCHGKCRKQFLHFVLLGAYRAFFDIAPLLFLFNFFGKKRRPREDRLSFEVILSPEASLGQRCYSDLRATTGSRFAATDDGTSPAITVRQKLITIIKSACRGLNTHSVSEPIFARFWMITLTIGCRI